MASKAMWAHRARTRALWFLALLVTVLIGMLLTANPAHAATTFTVNYRGDGPDAVPGNGLCRLIASKRCTLRAAIEEANATAGADTIEFDIGGGGVRTIRPNSQLPEVQGAVTIDGYTQPGASKNTLAKGTNAVLKIQLSGENAGADAAGLRIDRAGSMVRGLVINRFSRDGILLSGGGNATNNKVQGNFIGTNVSGTSALPNLWNGVQINNASNCTIGGSKPAARNLISGNDGDGVLIVNGLAIDNAVLGNLIGTEKDGTGDLGNSDYGVSVHGGGQSVVGGNTAGAANTIAFNGDDGVQVAGQDNTGNSILRNSIFSNGGLGIDLEGPQPNDPGDADTGPNNFQNKPNLTSAENSGGETTVKGTLNSVPNRTFRVRFFSNPSGNEGKKYIGAKSVTTNANGNTGTFAFKPKNKVGAGQRITATATGTSTGDTSEFSGPEKVV